MTDTQKEQICVLRKQGRSYTEIAASLSLSKNTVKSYCKRNALQAVAVENISHCKNCGAPIPIVVNGRTRQFCSDKCRLLWWKAHNLKVYSKPVYDLVCHKCGSHFQSIGNPQRKYCSHNCYISARFGKERGGDE